MAFCVAARLRLGGSSAVIHSTEADMTQLSERVDADRKIE